jgi:hypothetical protein
MKERKERRPAGTPIRLLTPALARTIEAEEPVRSELVALGQSFQLFPPERTIPDNGDGSDIPNYSSRLLLATDGLLPVLPVVIEAREGWTSPLHALSPFTPQYGYQVTPEDLQADTRGAKAKWLATVPEQIRGLDSAELNAAAPLLLQLSGGPDVRA